MAGPPRAAAHRPPSRQGARVRTVPERRKRRRRGLWQCNGFADTQVWWVCLSVCLSAPAPPAVSIPLCWARPAPPRPLVAGALLRSASMCHELGPWSRAGGQPLPWVPPGQGVLGERLERMWVYMAPSGQRGKARRCMRALSACHACTLPCTQSGVCGMPVAPRLPAVRLSLAGVSQGTLALRQPGLGCCQTFTRPCCWWSWQCIGT